MSEENIDRMVDDFIKRKSVYLVGAVIRRFWNYGRDGSGNLIGGGKYSPYTVEKKKKSPYARTSHVTLKDSGRWHDSLFAVYRNGTLELDSDMPGLTEKLISGEGKHFLGYGKDIMEFTEEELLAFEDKILKSLRDKLKELFNPVIDITI